MATSFERLQFFVAEYDLKSCFQIFSQHFDTDNREICIAIISSGIVLSPRLTIEQLSILAPIYVDEPNFMNEYQNVCGLIETKIKNQNHYN